MVIMDTAKVLEEQARVIQQQAGIIAEQAATIKQQTEALEQLGFIARSQNNIPIFSRCMTKHALRQFKPYFAI